MRSPRRLHPLLSLLPCVLPLLGACLMGCASDASESGETASVGDTQEQEEALSAEDEKRFLGSWRAQHGITDYQPRADLLVLGPNHRFYLKRRVCTSGDHLRDVASRHCETLPPQEGTYSFKTIRGGATPLAIFASKHHILRLDADKAVSDSRGKSYDNVDYSYSFRDNHTLYMGWRRGGTVDNHFLMHKLKSGFCAETADCKVLASASCAPQVQCVNNACTGASDGCGR